MDGLRFSIDYRFQIIIVTGKYSIKMESSFVSNAVISEVRLANLGYYGVADNFGYAGFSTSIGEELLGENHGAISPA